RSGCSGGCPSRSASPTRARSCAAWTATTRTTRGWCWSGRPASAPLNSAPTGPSFPPGPPPPDPHRRAFQPPLAVVARLLRGERPEAGFRRPGMSGAVERAKALDPSGLPPAPCRIAPHLLVVDWGKFLRSIREGHPAAEHHAQALTDFLDRDARPR